MNKNTGLNQTLLLEEAAQQIRSRANFSRADFVAFVGVLLVDLRDRPQEWENPDLRNFLEAMMTWVEDMDGYYQNIGEAVPEQPSWKTMAQILLAARVYE